MAKSEPNPLDILFGQRLRLARNLRHMSQEELGNALPKPISFQQIQKYELGINRISTSRLVEFCRALQMPIQFFVEELELPDKGELLVFTKQEMAIIRAYRKQADKNRKVIYNFIISLPVTRVLHS